MQLGVLAARAAMKERYGDSQLTPGMYAICEQQPAVALWLIKHRGLHDLETRNQ